jgi:biotin carboxylase
MKLLNIEVVSRGEIFYSRYDIFRENGADIYHLTTTGKEPNYEHFSGIKEVKQQVIENVVEAAVEWHQEIQFDAVITTDEASIFSVAKVAEKLDLPGISSLAAQNSRNKFFMREAHLDYYAPHPKFSLCNQLDKALSAAENIGYPVIIKPTLGASSEHIYLVKNEEDMKVRFPLAESANSKYSFCVYEAGGSHLGPNTMLVEEYLSGSEHCIEAWVMDGIAHIGSIADRICVELDIFDNDLYRTPSLLDQTHQDMLQEALQAGVQAQGITHGVVHAEFRFHNGKPYIVEIAARVGGGSLYKMAQISYDYCPIKTAFMVASNKQPNKQALSASGKFSVGLTMLCESGKVKRIHVPEAVLNHSQVFNLAIVLKAGSYCHRPPEGNDVLGYIGTIGESQEEAIALAAELSSQIQIEFEESDTHMAMEENKCSILS